MKVNTQGVKVKEQPRAPSCSGRRQVNATTSSAEEDSNQPWAPSRSDVVRLMSATALWNVVTGCAAEAKVDPSELKGVNPSKAKPKGGSFKVIESSKPDFLVRPDLLREQNLQKEARKLIKEAQKEFRDKEAACALLDKAVQVAPNYAPTWSNRAVFFYNQNEYDKALQDIEVAYALEQAAVGKKNVDLSVLEAYGDISLAKGLYTDALNYYGQIEKKTLDPEGFKRASVNYIFTLYEMGFEPEATKKTRKLLKKAPDLYDMRAFLVAGEWSVGREESAIEEWELFQRENPFGQSYNDVKAVQGRWPPKAVAALNAFKTRERKATSILITGEVKEYSFDCNDPNTKPHWRRAACRGPPPAPQSA